MNYFVDIAIIGGGASGLVAAITAKKANPNAQIYIFEALDRVGKKLITTGNGRCNISNNNLAPEHFHGEDVSFAAFALEKNNNQVIKQFFYEIGIPFVLEGDRYYPSSLQASSVVDCLRYECEKLNIKTICSCKIVDIETGKVFILHSENDRITAKSVICCTGLYSGGAKLGSDGEFFELLKGKNFKTVKTTPAIVQLKTETEFVRQLKGIKVNANALLLKNDKPIKSEFGEVLFCDYGLSGPAIMNISRDAMRSVGHFSVSLDLFPETSVKDLCDTLYDRVKLLNNRTLEDFFTGFLNKRLGQVVLKYCDFKLTKGVLELTYNDAKNISIALKDFKVKVTGNTGFVNSQVTAGGISTDEFYNDTLMSKRYPGLFACGELLDIDGDCGGYNLAWAWSSGILAAHKAIKFIGETK